MHLCLVLTLTVLPMQQDNTAFQAGSRELDGGNYKLAVKHFTQALTDNPKHVEAHLYRAEAYSKLDQYSEALGDLNSVLKLKPDAGSVFHLRGAIHFKLGKFR